MPLIIQVDDVFCWLGFIWGYPPPIGVSNLAHETPILPESQILVFPQTYLEQDILSEAIDLAKKSTGPSQQTATEIHCSYNLSV